MVRDWSRASTMMALIITLTIAALVTMGDDGGADPGPFVERPDGNGPMQVGQNDTWFRGSTKSYDTRLRVYYPAASHGIETPPDPSGAPYMTVVWFPHFGGGADAMGPQCEQLASWGAVVVAYGVNWEDMENSGNPDDINDLLDILEDLNTTAGHTLYGMVDKEAYGMCGYSSGGGASLITGAQVPRIKAIQSWAAAIYNAAVDGIAPMFNGRPLLLQVGKDDEMYIEGSERAYKKVGPPCILVEPHGAGHGGPFQNHMYIAFYLYHLKGEAAYFTFLYGDEAVGLAVNEEVDVYFKLNDDHFFPPKVTTTVSPLTVPMEELVYLNATIHGYQRENESELVHGWDVDGDGGIDLRLADEPNTTHIFMFPGLRRVQYHYELAGFTVLGVNHTVTVTNVRPVAVAGSDIEVDHDGSAQLDGGASWDTPTDGPRLLYRWEFSDGFETDTTSFPTVSRKFAEVGVLTATLTVRDPHGAEASDTLNITVVNVPPSVTAGDGLSVVEDSALEFEGIGTDTPSHSGLLLYKWDFGDGLGSEWRADARSNHTYTLSGNYTATLTVKDPEGAVASSSTNVTVLNIAPEGVIDLPMNGSEHDKGESVEFAANGSDTPSDEVYLMFMWDFGDGEVTDWLGRRDTQVSHAYVTAGTFQVVLTVMDSDGARSSVTCTISVVNTPPSATIVRPWPSAEVLEDTSVKFYGTGGDTPDDQDGLEYRWVIDGVDHAGDRAEHTFSESGTYEAIFRVTDPDGATTSVTVEVTVENVAPEATLEVDRTTIEAGESISYNVHLYDTPSDLEGLLITWDFGDTGTDHDANGTHAYATAGTYLVKVTVEDDDGDTAIASVTVTVTEPPAGPGDPPDGDGPDDTDEDGPNYLPIAAILGAILVVVALAAFYLMGRERTGDGGDGDEPPH